MENKVALRAWGTPKESLFATKLQTLLTSETTDDQLRELANRLCIRLDGIVFKDELIKLPFLDKNKTYNFVVHLRSPSHWVALHKPKNKHEMYYYNSFANHFGEIPQDIIDFAKKNKCVIYTSDKPIQRPQVGYCGPFAVLYLSYLNRPTNDTYDFNDYLSKFRDVTQDIMKYKERHPDLPY